MLQLLREPGLSIKTMDELQKAKVRRAIHELHIEQGVSLSDLAKLIGSKTSGYTSWVCRQLGVQARDFEEARLAGIHKKVRKYERKPFDGSDELKAYMLGLRHGDLYVYRPFGDAIRVSTSTTHPAMAVLFRKLFEPFGHVYQHPRYKKDTRSYEWNLQTVLDRSFEFLLLNHSESCSWIELHELRIRGYMAGIIDAEGNITMMPSHGKTSLSVSIHNTNLELISFVTRLLGKLGYHPRGPRLSKPRGPKSSGYGIEMKKDYWIVGIFRFKEVQKTLMELPLRHAEKIAMKELAVAMTPGVPWAMTIQRVKAVRSQQHAERDEFVQRAKLEFLKTHLDPT